MTVPERTMCKKPKGPHYELKQRFHYNVEVLKGHNEKKDILDRQTKKNIIIV